MRVLIVSPHFPPTNAADMQRVRLLLPYLSENGISAEVLAVEPEQVAAPADAWLTRGLPDEVTIHRVQALGLNVTRVPGFGTLTNRALGALRRQGDELLKVRDFDLIYFSTTQFGVHVLGPRWKRKFGVPFVMDYQDPWVSDYYRTHPDVTPPGGRLKYAIASWLARRAEPKVLQACSGVTSVSAAYPQQLQARYPQTMRGMPVLVAPFPGDDRDFDSVRTDPKVKQTFFVPTTGSCNWVYVGRGGPDMHRAVRSFFLAVASHLRAQPTLSDRLRIHFIGTSYASSGTGKQSLMPIAAEYGLTEMVSESTDRIPYSSTLRCLLDADALIVPGSDDPGYTASKIYPYLLARKPLLAIFHESSSVVELIRKVGGAVVIPFGKGDRIEETAKHIEDGWLVDAQYKHAVSLDENAFFTYTASYQAICMAEFFTSCVQTKSQP